MFADFLLKILKWDPADRPTSQEMLEHPWLTMPDKYNYKMSEMEYKLFELKDAAVKMENEDIDINALTEYKALLVN
jgi:serine/threonine protein kinase